MCRLWRKQEQYPQARQAIVHPHLFKPVYRLLDNLEIIKQVKEKLRNVGHWIIAKKAVIAITVAAIAVFLTLNAVIQPLGTNAVVATKRITAGEIITAQDVEMRSHVAGAPPDVASDPTLVVGLRTSVTIEPEIPIRTAYVTITEQSMEGRDTVALPVVTDVAALFTQGDTLDIYSPATCEDETQNCPARLLTQKAIVTKVAIPAESQWNGAQTATLVLAITRKDTPVVAGVTDSATITLVKTSQN